MIRFWDFKLTGAPPLLSLDVQQPLGRVSMAKILRGRIAGRHGMGSHTSEELHAWADRFEGRAGDPDDADDGGWLLRWAERLRCLAEQKERARDHKRAVALSRSTKRALAAQRRWVRENETAPQEGPA